LGNQFLSNIRETDAIAEVVRVFEDENVHHVHGEINPMSDIGVINLELILADAQTVSKRISNLEKEVKRGDKVAIAEKAVLEKVSDALSLGKLANTVELTKEEKEIVKSMHLITMKPVLYVLNKKAGAKNIIDDKDDPRTKELLAFLNDGQIYAIVDAGIEQELKDLEGEDKEIFRKELQSENDGINDLIKAGYQILGLMTFFTTGEDETRAWTIKKDSTAPIAGMAIHNDFKDKFIRAEVVFWKDLLDATSFGKAREKGLVRTEGKEYMVKDGDVIEFKV